MKKNKRFILLVIDGLGVGEMPDVKTSRPQDRGANTLKNIVKHNPKIKIPNLRSLGIIDYFVKHKFNKKTFRSFPRSFGKSTLAHFGADSFMGHQEMSGTKPVKPLQQFIVDKRRDIMDLLRKKGIATQYSHGIIFLKKNIAISDNIESDYGFNMNVIGSLDTNSYEKIVSVGKIVRRAVQVGRVITMGGKGINTKKILSCVEYKQVNGKKVSGINVPRLGIYNENYRVVHLGAPIVRDVQSPQILARDHFPVVFIGKAADVMTADGAEYLPAVHTEEILDHLFQKLKKVKNGLIFANIQETDLAGHSQNVSEYSRHLELLDTALPKILKLMGGNDVFVITGDHGNDPTIGHSFHTREFTPLIILSKQMISRNLGTRSTLADIGASICNYFSLMPPEHGSSFFLSG